MKCFLSVGDAERATASGSGACLPLPRVQTALGGAQTCVLHPRRMVFHAGMGWVPWGDNDQTKHPAMTQHMDIFPLKLEQEKHLQAVNTYLNTLSMFELWG